MKLVVAQGAAEAAQSAVPPAQDDDGQKGRRRGRLEGIRKVLDTPPVPSAKEKKTRPMPSNLRPFPIRRKYLRKKIRKRDEDKGEDEERVSGGPKWNLRCASMDLLLFPAAAQQAAKKVPIVILKRMEIWRQTCRRLSFLSEVTMFCYTAPLFQPH